MRTKAFAVLLALISFFVFSIPDLADARGGGRGSGRGHSGSHSGKSSSGKSHGGSYKGGGGSSHKGGKYKNPRTGDQYQQRGGKSSGTSSGKSSSSKHYSAPQNYNGGVKRDSHGRIKRSQGAKHEFLKQHGYSKVPKGMQVDHIVPLYAGGKDVPSNMRLLTTRQHQQKTRDDFKKYGR